MADNLNITSGSGILIATDQDPTSSAHFQRIKLVDGNLNSTAATGVNANPLIVAITNTSNTVLVSGDISVLNTISTVTVLNTRTTATVSGTVTSIVTGGVSVLNTIAVSCLNTVSSVSVLGTQTVNVLNTVGSVNILDTQTVNVLNTRTAVTITGMVTVSGGITLLSASAVTVSGTVTSIVSGGVTLLSSSTVTISGGVTLLSSTGLNILGTQTVNVLNTRIAVTVSGTATVSGGISLLSPNILAISNVPSGATPTWIYAMLPSNNGTAVWNPGAAQRFNITDITVSNLSASTITITQDSTSAITIMKLALNDRGGWVSNFQTPYVATTTKHVLYATTSVTNTNAWICVSGYLSS